jgi:hypothetical protein
MRTGMAAGGRDVLRAGNQLPLVPFRCRRE